MIVCCFQQINCSIYFQKNNETRLELLLFVNENSCNVPDLTTLVLQKVSGESKYF